MVFMLMCMLTGYFLGYFIKGYFKIIIKGFLVFSYIITYK